MEQRHLTDEQFDALWQEAGARARGERLAAGYPAWRRRQRHATAVAAMLALLAGVAVPMLAQPADMPVYGSVYCNRADIPDSQWTNLAADMLLEA